MTQSEFYQQALTKSAEVLLNAEASVRSYADLLARMKEECIAKEIVGKIYNIDDLMRKENYQYKYLESKKLKCVMVKSRVGYRSTAYIQSRDSFHSFISVEACFLADPNSILNSKQKVTDKEKKLLKTLAKYYDVIEGENQSDTDYSKVPLSILAGELSYLKNRYHIYLTLTWGFSFEEVISSYFLTKGIRAVRPLF